MAGWSRLEWATFSSDSPVSRSSDAADDLSGTTRPAPPGRLSAPPGRPYRHPSRRLDRPIRAGIDSALSETRPAGSADWHVAAAVPVLVVTGAGDAGMAGLVDDGAVRDRRRGDAGRRLHGQRH